MERITYISIMPPPRNILFSFRLPRAEADLLARHAEATGRTKTDLLREFIRSLETRETSRPLTRKSRGK